MSIIPSIDSDAKNLAIYNLLVQNTKYQWSNYDFLLAFLLHRFENYSQYIYFFEGYVKQKVLESKDLTRCLFPKIIESVSFYLQGKIFQSYKSMQTALESVNSLLIRKSSRQLASGIEIGFRARIFNEKDLRLPHSRADMFHIPFEKRHLVKDQRYSIHGVPSIYLGRSIYDCYLELGKPSLDTFWVSLFGFTQKKTDMLNSRHLKLVDLTFADETHDIPLIWSSVKKDDVEYMRILDMLVDDILLWPLIMACSIVCKYPDAPFKQEYIVPQMVYQFCNDKNEFSGVRYYSTKLESVGKNKIRSAMINIALPTQKIKRSGYCPDLARYLVLTEPICVQAGKNTRIDAKYGWTPNGIPILSKLNSNLGQDKTIVALDQMACFFDNLLNQFSKRHDLSSFQPLYGWNENESLENS